MVHVSASSLNKFWSCPYKLYLSKHWTARKEPEHFANGSLAHEMMENGEAMEDVSSIALSYYRQLQKGEEALGYEVLERENKEKFLYTLPSGREVTIHRIIDVYAMRDGKPLVVDYKTTMRGWKMQGAFYPKAQGFQAEMYRLPSDTSPYEPNTTPDLLFLVATQRTVLPVFHQTVAGDRDNLLYAMELYAQAVEDGQYPKIRGFGCKYCDYSSICYNVPGHEIEFKERKKW